MLFLLEKTYIDNGDKMFEKVKKYINDDEFQMILKENNLYITSFEKLISLEEKEISFLTKTKRIKVSGKNLMTRRILEKELMITGTLEKIEVFDE